MFEILGKYNSLPRFFHFKINIMKVKILKVRISDQFQNMDEAVLNDYLERYEIISINSQLVQDEIKYCSVFINYKQKQVKPI